GTLVNRLVRRGILSYDVIFTYNNRYTYFVSGYACFMEFSSHVLIAANRYTAFVYPMAHKQ
ncbi:hypothetical protein AAVH_23598, partial [Aphelenchoides avenae]